MNKISLAVVALLFFPALARTHGPMPLEAVARGGEIVARPINGDLQTTLEEIADSTGRRTWVTYLVPIVSGDRDLCCHGFRGSSIRREACSLGKGPYSITIDDEIRAPSTNRALRVVWQLHRGGVRNARVFRDDCSLDLDGSPIFDLGRVDGAESVRVLHAVIDEKRHDEYDHEIMAIAMHADESAGELLSRLLRKGSREVRARAAFWLADRDGKRALPLLRRALAEEKEPELRDELVFAVSVIRDPAAVDLLIEVARDDTRRATRESALFWLAEQAGEKAIETLRDVAENDGDAEVRENAVFGLSRLPPERAVPLLIDLIRRNRHPEVRKQAAFWLGQSGDPRALDFFEEILTR